MARMMTLTVSGAAVSWVLQEGGADTLTLSTVAALCFLILSFFILGVSPTIVFFFH